LRRHVGPRLIGSLRFAALWGRLRSLWLCTACARLASRGTTARFAFPTTAAMTDQAQLVAARSQRGQARRGRLASARTGRLIAVALGRAPAGWWSAFSRQSEVPLQTLSRTRSRVDSFRGGIRQNGRLGCTTRGRARSWLGRPIRLSKGSWPGTILGTRRSWGPRRQLRPLVFRWGSGWGLASRTSGEPGANPYQGHCAVPPRPLDDSPHSGTPASQATALRRFGDPASRRNWAGAAARLMGVRWVLAYAPNAEAAAGGTATPSSSASPRAALPFPVHPPPLHCGVSNPAAPSNAAQDKNRDAPFTRPTVHRLRRAAW
jgi:hypothetical protein